MKNSKNLTAKKSKNTALLINISVFFIYLTASVVLFGFPALLAPKTRFIGASADSTLFIWLLEWWPYALSHHLNPFMTAYMWEPQGIKSLLWINAIPGLSLLFSPVTLVLGPIAANNVIAVISPAASSFFAYLLIKYLTKSPLAAAFGGYFYGFSPYAFTNVDMNLYFVCLIPLLIYLFFLGLDNKINKLFYIAATSICIALEFLISVEVFTTMTFFGFLSLITGLFIFKTGRRRLAGFIPYVSVSYLISFILISPFLYNMISTIRYAPKYPLSAMLYSVNLINVVIPAPIIFIGGGLFAGTGFKLMQDISYMGIFIILLLIFYMKDNLKTQAGKFLIIMFSVVFIFSLGPYLHIINVNAGLPLPWLIFYGMPLIQKAVPIRFMLYAYLFISIIVGYFVSQSSKSGKKIKIMSYSVVFLSILSIIPTQYFFESDTHTPKFFLNGVYKKYLKRGSNVLIIPFSNDGYSLAYQAETGYYFKLAGGYYDFIQGSYTRNPVFNILIGDRGVKKAGNCDKYALKYFLASHSVHYIIIIRGKMSNMANYNMYHPYESFKNLVGVLNLKPKMINGVALYNVHKRLLENKGKIYKDYVKYCKTKTLRTK